MFASLGLNGIVVRELAQSPEHQNEVLGTTFTLKLVGGAFTQLAGVAAINLLRPKDSLVHWLFAVIAAGRIF